MVKRNVTNESKMPLELLVALDSARQKLVERIEQGIEIKNNNISSAQDLDATRKIYSKWSSFNKELLKRLFTTDELAKEYSGGAFGISSIGMYEPSLGEKTQDLHEDIDGKIHRLDSIKARIELIPTSKTVKDVTQDDSRARAKIDKNKIFIVHGHDNEAKLEVARFIEKIGFEPIILHEQASGSKTIIEKIEAYTDVGFGVVLYTPCDIGSKNSDPPNLMGRARQNVVFEHGFLIGKLKRSNVCSLVKGDIETPNDISGIVYTSMDDSGWKVELAKELRSAGYPVDMNKVI